MTREHKLALIIGFSLVLVVGVLISDHFSKARSAQVATEITAGGGPNFGAGTSNLRVVSQPTPVPNGSGMVASGNNATMITPAAPLPGSMDPAPAPSAPGELVMGGKRSSLGGLLGGDQTALAKTTNEPQSGMPSDGSGVRPLTPKTSPIAGGAAPDTVPPQPIAVTPAPAKPDPAKFETVNGIQVPLAMMKRHDVKEGESIYRIAQDAYGDGKLWSKVADCNKGKMGPNGSLRVGVTLLLPPKEALLGKPLSTTAEAVPEKIERTPLKTEPKETHKPVETAMKDPAPSKIDRKAESIKEAMKAESRPEKPLVVAKTYTVQKGDSLSDIAKKTLGSSKRWSEIVDINKDTLSDEDSLVVGSTLKIPGR